MTWQFDVNNNALGANDGIGAALLGMVRNMVAAGAASIVGSGDGISTYENQGQTAGPTWDVLTGDTSIWNSLVANEFSNTGAWVRFRMTGTTLEWIIFRRTSSTASYEENIIMRLSVTGFDNGDADANLPPTASAGDEKDLCGTWPSTFGIFSSYEKNIYWHAGCEDTAQNGFYPFYLLITDQSGQDVDGLIFFDVITDEVGTDAHPWVFYSGFTSIGMTEAEMTSPSGNRGRAYRDYGGAQELWVDETHAMMVGNGTEAMFPGGVPAQHDDGLARDMPVIWGEPGISFFKGVSRNIRWKGTPTRIYPDTVDLASADARIYVDDCLIPWKQNETPL